MKGGKDEEKDVTCFQDLPTSSPCPNYHRLTLLDNWSMDDVSRNVESFRQ